VGCNDGFFSIPAAQIVGEKGKVYGVDIDSEAISRLQKKAVSLDIHNITTTAGSAESTLFCSNCADIVFLGTVLHDFQDPLLVLQNAYKMLVKNGRLINLDWKKEATPMGPPLEKRFSEEKASSLLRQAGFVSTTTIDYSPYYYLVSASK
jgi:ubiquinone/menaquinone biosynthesis C-methylase UbiE